MESYTGLEAGYSFIYFSSGVYGRLVFEELLKNGLIPVCVVTSPDKPRGRGLKIRPHPIKEISILKGIPVLTPVDLNSDDFLTSLRSYSPDFIFLCDFGRILPKEVLEVPRYYSLNLHPSDLPKYRGPAPIERAILNNESKIGLTLIKMTQQVDKGPILLKDSVEIGYEMTKGDILPILAKKGFELIKKFFELFRIGQITFLEQKNEEASYAGKVREEECWLDFKKTREEVHLKIRAFSPEPGARVMMNRRLYLFLRSRLPEDIPFEGQVGEIKVLSKKRLLIGASNGWVEIMELKPEGKRLMKASEFLQGLREPLFLTPVKND